MTDQTTLKELPREEKKRAERLLRNFLIVFVLAIVAEVALRLTPDILRDMAERRWLEWMVVSLIGICTYLIWNISLWYRRPEAQFIDYTPWYRATATRGPIIALVILLALTNISFQVDLPASEGAASDAFDFGIDFGQASEPVLLITAFLLGFYSRLAKDLLGRIARAIFGQTYDETYGEEE